VITVLSAVLAGCCRGDGAPPARTNSQVRPAPAAVSEIKADEEVVFFPTTAHLDEATGEWVIPVHGVIYEPETDSRRRAVVAAAVRRAAQTPADTPESQRLDQRVRLFLVDNERGKRITVRIGSETFDAGTSGPNGHFQAVVRRTPAQLKSHVTSVDGQDYVSFAAVTRQSDARSFAGRVQLVSPEGLSVISDIDDTIKHTEVRNHREVLANTFLREFEPVPGMPALYRQWAQQGIVFHYVSGSPWQLYLPLAEFFAAHQLPVSSVSLKDFRVKDPTTINLLQSQEDAKRRAIEPILEAFPRRQFILIGDSGEQDPEIYAQLARTHGRQIVAVFIRNVTQEQPDNQRLAALVKELNEVRFELFADPAALASLLAVRETESEQ